MSALVYDLVMDDEKLKFKKVDELVALRTSIIQVLIVLVSGTIGLVFTNIFLVKLIFIPLGFFYTCVLALNLDSIGAKINALLNSGKGNK